MNWRCLTLLAASAGIAYAADVDSSALLARVHSKVLDNERRVPRYICRQQIERRAYTQIGRKWLVSIHSGCGSLPQLGLLKMPGLTLATTDRAHLDVMLAGGEELFAWPGGRTFDTDDPSELLGDGLSGAGDFASFMLSIFTLDRVTFRYQGPCPGQSCVRYGYDVPREVSRYFVQTALSKVTLGFHGTFDVDPESADLIQLMVNPTDISQNIPMACDLRTRMSYTRASMKTGDFTIPKSTEREYLAKDGGYSVNRVSYQGCREYTAESVLSFDGDPTSASPKAVKAAPPLPATGSELRLRLASKIDPGVNFAGDSLEATLDRPVRDTQGGKIPAGTVFRGHLAQLEKVYFPKRQVVIAIRFDSMVINGAPLPLRLEPDGEVDERGHGVFRLAGPRSVLRKGVITHWRVASTVPAPEGAR